MKYLKLATVLSVVMASFVFAGSALASTQHTASSQRALRGQCGGQIHSWQQYVNNLAVFGAVAQAANINRSAGYSARDGSFTQWLKERVVYARLAAPARITNYGCNANGVFPAGKKYLTKGWPVLVALPGKYSKSDIRMTPKRGYRAVSVHVHLVAQASCTNPGKAIVKVVIYVKVKVKPQKQPNKPVVKTPTTPSICNNINSPGGIACSTITYVNVCGIQVPYTGNQKDIQTWVSGYIADHCAPTVNTNVCTQSGALNYGQTGPCAFPAPVCQDHNASNYGGSLPCVYPPAKCTDTSATNYGGSLPCQYPAPKCTDHNATNYGGSLPCQYLAPVTHTVQVGCTGFEEIAGGESMLIKCDVSDDNGAPISLDARSNDANSYVSGINCYSQGGTPSCNGNGQFEFRVNGVNNGSGDVMSSVTVTATANGQHDTHTYSFKVDPYDNGFGG